MGLLGKLLGTDASSKPHPVSVHDANFDAEVASSELPVLLDVWSPGCAPCRQLEPVIMDLAREYDGRVKVCEMNAQHAPTAATRLGIRGTPTVVYIRDGKEVERVVGFRSSLYHREALQELFGV